jgi:methylated-DNA-[protein]-cysteine S-methyltransferase
MLALNANDRDEDAMRTYAAASGEERYCLFPTAMGACGVAWSERGLTRLQLPEADRAATERRLRHSRAHPDSAAPPRIAKAIALVQRHIEGERVDYRSVELDLSGVSPFHAQIYEATRALGWGETASYGELARRVGSAGAARAVGQAMGRNPVPIIIPCHRVLASGRKPGGFSAFGGLDTKERLLALEGVSLGGDQPCLPGLRMSRRR